MGQNDHGFFPVAPPPMASGSDWIHARESGMTDRETPRANPAAMAVMYGLGLAAVTIGGSRLVHNQALRQQILDGGVALAAVIVVVGALVGSWVHSRRTTLVRIADGLEAVMHLDTSQPGGGVKASRWRGSRPRRPTRLVITYRSGFNDRDVKARGEVADILRTRLGADVDLQWSPARTRIEVRADVTGRPAVLLSPTAPEPLDQQGQLRARALSVAQSVLGPTTDLVEAIWDKQGTLTSLEFSYATTSRDTSPAFRQRLLSQVDAKLPGDWIDQWDMDHDHVTFRQRPPFPRDVRFPLDRALTYAELPYAVDSAGVIESWTLGSKHPHALAVGPTGTGKTIYIRNLITAASLLGIPVIICDPKRVEYLDFKDWPNVLLVTDPAEIAATIGRVHSEMNLRYNLIESGDAKKGGFGKILFILDEYYVFKTLMASVWAEIKAADSDLKGSLHPCFGQFSQLAVLARTAEAHMVIGIQRPDAEFLTGVVRDSLRNRISLGQLGREAATMMWENPRTGTNIPSIQGRATAVTGHGPAEVQVLRLITPSDTDVYDAEDAAVWGNIVRRVHSVPLNADVADILARIGTGRRNDPLAKRPAPADAVPTSGAGSAAPSPTRAGVLAPTRADALAPGDTVVLDGSTALVEEAGEGESGIDLVLLQDGATRFLTLAPDTEVHVLDDDSDSSAPVDLPPAAPLPVTPAAPATGTGPQVQSRNEDEDWGASLEAVPAYSLEPGDTVMIEDPTGIPELVQIDDVVDDGEGGVELSYQSLEDGAPGTIAMDGDTRLQRRTTS